MSRTVWLASYPKSGNTWVRAILTALGTHPHLFAVDDLDHGGQPFHLGSSLPVLGLDARWLSYEESELLRDVLITRQDESSGGAPLIRKTHEVYRSGLPGREPFPTPATRAAVYIVRDPRDVACSYAPFFGVDLDAAIEAMSLDGGELQGRPSHITTSQPWGTWSTHVLSWLSDDVPFPVHRVRYEDLKRDPVGTLLPVLQAIGIGCSRGDLERAVGLTRFERLQRLERELGFRETSPKTNMFFRSGQDGGWRSELSKQQLAAIEADHEEVMGLLGYEAVSDDVPKRRALAQSRQSRRRAARTGHSSLPDHLGIVVEFGPVPEAIPGASFPKPWLQVSSTEAIVEFAGPCRLWVRGGTRVVVDWPSGHGEDDPSWLLHGWAVTLAMLQRGLLSLHAATVKVRDEVVAIAGSRGAGKSTTAMALRARGHPLLCDDVTLVEFRGDGAWTTPFERNVHLVEDAAAAVGLDADALPTLAGGRMKVAFRPEPPDPVPHRIDRIIVLAKITDSQSNRGVQVEHPQGAERVRRLLAHTRRDGIAPVVLGEAEYFRQVTRLADCAPMTFISRTDHQWSLDEVAEVIEAES